MARQRFANNWKASLVAAVAPADLKLRVTSGASTKLPALTAGDWFVMTLLGTTGAAGPLEIVRVNAVAEVSGACELTVVRAQEGTTAAAFGADGSVRLYLTAAGIDGKLGADFELLDAAEALDDSEVLALKQGGLPAKRLSISALWTRLLSRANTWAAAQTFTSAVTTPSVSLRSPTTTAAAGLTGMHGSTVRWTVNMPTGSGDYAVYPHDDDGASRRGWAMTIHRGTGDATFSNSLFSGPSHFLSAAAGVAVSLVGRQAGITRWVMEMPTAGNGHLALHSYNAAGTFQRTAMLIDGATGLVSIADALQVNVQRATYAVYAQGYGGSSATRVVGVIEASSVGGASRMYFVYRPGIGAYCQIDVDSVPFSLSSSGVGSSPGGWVATSDGRVKLNRMKVEHALDKVQTLTTYTYDRCDMLNGDKTMQRRVGLIAQDVLAVLPEAVHVPLGYDPNSAYDPDAAVKPALLSLDHNGVIGLLVESVKELAAQNRALTARLDALEAGQ